MRSFPSENQRLKTEGADARRTPHHNFVADEIESALVSAPLKILSAVS